MYVSCRRMWEACLGLKAIWVMGVSRSSQSLCRPCCCSFRLQGVYSLSTMLNSNSWEERRATLWGGEWRRAEAALLSKACAALPSTPGEALPQLKD